MGREARKAEQTYYFQPDAAITQFLIALSGFLLLPSSHSSSVSKPQNWASRSDMTSVSNASATVHRTLLIPRYVPKIAGTINGHPNIIATIRQASVRIGRLIWHDVLADTKFFKATIEHIRTRDFFIRL